MESATTFAQLGDKSAIAETLTRYTLALDDYDIDGLMTCFAEDAELVTTVDEVKGEEAIRERYDRLRGLQAERGEQPRHVVTNVSIALQGDHADVVSYYTLFVAAAGEVQLRWVGRYVDRMVRIAAGWRLERREIQVDGQA